MKGNNIFKRKIRRNLTNGIKEVKSLGCNGEVRWASELSDNRGYSDEALGTDELLIALFMDLGKDFLESSIYISIKSFNLY